MFGNHAVIANLVGHRDDSAKMFERAIPVMVNALLAAFGMSALSCSSSFVSAKRPRACTCCATGTLSMLGGVTFWARE